MSKGIETHKERQVRLIKAKIERRWNLLKTTNVGQEAAKILRELDDLEHRLRLAEALDE